MVWVRNPSATSLGVCGSRKATVKWHPGSPCPRAAPGGGLLPAHAQAAGECRGPLAGGASSSPSMPAHSTRATSPPSDWVSSDGEGERMNRWKSEAICNLISKVTADYLCCAQLEVESLILALTRQSSRKTVTVILLTLSLPHSLGGKASALLWAPCSKGLMCPFT